MRTLKNALMVPNILAFPYPSEPIKLNTDACNVYRGCFVSQKHLDDVSKPIWYCSRSLTDPKKQN